ncbi:MAG TPA: AAA family ATPase [Treponemataceae bacterium]|nr:AAA family ATPase [Treponemataceae bacterium]HQF74446.1 AAA family ATPase [Treponemataceae bacterium]
MIIILNGSVGSGKSTVSEELQVLFDKSVMLDGDYIGLIHPFEIYDDARIEYLYKTLLLLVEFHHSNGYNDFVINYVFESPESLKNLTNRLVTIIPEIHCFWLTCSEAEQKKRIQKRRRHDTEWELKRFSKLNAIQQRASEEGFIGERIQTDGLDCAEVAAHIMGRINAGRPS